MRTLSILIVVLITFFGGFAYSQSGGLDVLVGGESVWPPKGPGCDELVKCCDAFKNDSTVTLGCKLATAKKPLDCKEALKTSKQMIVELGKKLPEECK